MSVFKLHGVRTPHRKHTEKSVPVRMPVPPHVCIPVSMHIGAPAVPAVKAGDSVAVGDCIARENGFVSASVYSGVSGTVAKIDTLTMPNGVMTPTVIIDTDGLQTVSDTVKPPVITDSASFIAAVRASGCVGMGGAGFPTAVKLNVQDLSRIRAVIINGAECEPYITSDTRTMLDRTEALADGIRLLEKYLGVTRVIIGIEKNKPAAIAAMRCLAKDDSCVEVKVLPSLYPQGGEKVLIYHTLGAVVPEGKLPLDVGALVLNCTTLAFISDYCRTGMPLVEKCITVDGSAVAKPANVIAPIGTRLEDVFAFCGGFSEKPEKVLYGGPMMGLAVPDLSYPILKNTNAVLAFGAKEAVLPQVGPCIRCSRCINHCPLRLNPPAIAHAFSASDMQELSRLKVNLCMECGCCAYECPANRPIVQNNKLAKAALAAYVRAHKE